MDHRVGIIRKRKKGRHFRYSFELKYNRTDEKIIYVRASVCVVCMCVVYIVL